LTKLYNRLKTDEKLQEEYEKILRYENYKCSVILLDVDHFKDVNDEHGHQIGDKILIELADVLQYSTRKTDMVGRWGGEEFMIILPNTACNEAMEVASLLKSRVEYSNFCEHLNITISLGVGELRTYLTIPEAINYIDAALYHSKKNGRNKVTRSE
jgi:diguanylate cyclase (GGDEF)-like protein